MIPFGLLAGFADDKEIRLIELAENGFKFRLQQEIADVGQFRICFYNSNDSAYREIQVKEFCIQKEQQEQYGVFCIYRAGRFQKRSAGTCRPLQQIYSPENRM